MMRPSYFIFCLAVLFLFACEKPIQLDTNIYDCNLSILDDTETHPNAVSLQDALDELTKTLPGVQATIMTKDDLLWSGASGMADIPNNVAMKSCTKTMMGSISKIFTAVLIMQLEEESLLDINDNISSYLPSDLINPIPNGTEVNIRNLLNHNSGIPDYLDVSFHIDAINQADFILTQEEKMERLHGSKAEFPVGEKYSYSNSNYVLLGLIVEAIREVHLWTAIETYISNPLGLKNTLCGTESEPIPEGTARPYLGVGSNFIDIHQNSVSDAATGDGGIASCAQDLVLFFQALKNGVLVSDEQYQKMKNLTIPIEDDEHYGLGLEIFETDYGTAIGHSGSTSSYLAFLMYIEDQESILAFALNGFKQNGDAGQKINEFWKNLMRISYE